jgi:hypothetical protein
MSTHNPHNCYIPYCEECWHHFNPSDPNDPDKDGPVTCPICLADMDVEGVDMEEFDKLDEEAQWAVAKVFMETSEVSKENEITDALRQRGFVPEKEEN